MQNDRHNVWSQVVYGLINDRRQELAQEGQGATGPPRNDLLNALLISVDDDGKGVFILLVCLPLARLPGWARVVLMLLVACFHLPLYNCNVCV